MSEQKCINSIRCLGAAMPQIANSGHPGAPLGCAPMTHVLFSDVMKFSPQNPDWPGRDRFVLSNGHSCALLYSMLYLTGYDMTLEDLKRFRQLESKTPGHPERGHTKGVEVTTGPLGQGVAQAVGFAIAAEFMAKKYNTVEHQLFDNFIYVILGDGCLQEGVSSEACSLAGHLKLGRLVALYDKNNITIDGDTNLSFTEDVAKRFEAYGWEVLSVKDGDNNVDEIRICLEKSKKNTSKPSLIICNTTIGYGSVKQGSEKTHGAPLGYDDIKQMRKKFDLESTDIFHVPNDVLTFYRNCGSSGNKLSEKWYAELALYAEKYPSKYAELQMQLQNILPHDWQSLLPKYTANDKENSTRALSGIVLNSVCDNIPYIFGGSADLSGSNCTVLKNIADFTSSDRLGRYIRFGVREHAMAAICNGISAYGGLRAYGATFLNFITYAWGAVRLSALSKLPVLYIATHDSIELGEDGPTHQPIEVQALCRATPNLIYFRPGDGNEVSAGYSVWLSQSTTPVVLALSRNAVPHLEGSSIEKATCGGYTLRDFKYNNKPKVILGSCGTELNLCVTSMKELTDDFDVRVVSMPSWELFAKQTEDYQNCVLLKTVKKLYVEAGNALGYHQWFDDAIDIESFGASAPKDHLFNYFGFTQKIL